jgi:hypothetical protein
LEQTAPNIPSNWWYLLGVLLAVAGIAVFVVLQISKTDPDYRVVFPGNEDIELDEEEYTLFYEHTSIFNGAVFITDPIVPALRFFVVDTDKVGVPLDTPTVNKTYDFDGRAGYSVVNFKIEAAGHYTVGGIDPEKTIRSFFIFAVGKKTSGSLMNAIIALVGGLSTSAVLMGSTFATRRRG